MKKWICAVLMTAAMFALNSGSRPAAADEWGGCRWQCPTTGKWFLTASACDAACSAECDEIC